MRTYYTIPSLLFTLFIALNLSSCINKDFTMGSEFLDGKMRILQIDTTSIASYTYLEDSFATSGSKVVFVGNYNDPIFGIYKAASFISFKKPTSDVNQNFKLDSVTLKMYYTGDYYGDTTKETTFTVYKLQNLIELNFKTNLLYNNDNILYNELLNTYSFNPKPNLPAIIDVPKSKFIEVNLNKGLDYLFDTLKKSDLQNIDFRKLFYGLALIPDNASSSVCSFNFSDTLTSLNFYYHDITVKNGSLKVLKIRSEPTYQFNKVDQDRTGSLLKDLEPGKKLSSTKTNNTFFLQASRGVSGIIEFPGLSNLLNLDHANNVQISKGILSINIMKGSFGKDALLPDSLYLDVLNNRDEVLTSYTTATLSKDNIFNTATYYVDITSFLRDQLINSMFAEKVKRLKIVVPQSNNKKYLRKAIVGDQNNEAPYKLKTTIKLMLYVDK